MLQLPQPPGASGTPPKFTLWTTPDPTHRTFPPRGIVTPGGKKLRPGIETVASRMGDGAPPVLVSSHARHATTTSATIALTRNRTEGLIMVKGATNLPTDEGGWKRPVRPPEHTYTPSTTLFRLFDGGRCLRGDAGDVAAQSEAPVETGEHVS